MHINVLGFMFLVSPAFLPPSSLPHQSSLQLQHAQLWCSHDPSLFMLVL